MGYDFFGLTPKDKHYIHEEIFSLCYHGQGGFTQSEVYNMPIYLRKFYINQIVKTIKEQNKRNASAPKHLPKK